MMKDPRDTIQEGLDRFFSDDDITATEGTMSPTPQDFIPETEHTVTSRVGEAGAIDLAEEKELQTVPDDAAVGDVGYISDPTEHRPGLFSRVFKPQEYDQPKPTPENEFKNSNEAVLSQVADALRYLSKDSIRVINTTNRFLKITSHVVSDVPARVAGYQTSRKILVVRLAGGNTVYLGDSQDVTADAGNFPITSSDRTITITAQAEVWAVCATGQTDTIHMIGEHY